ncbi:MAG: N-acetylmannosamine-6-phosphate 2-epimerase [Anaerolineae bacterium]
MRCHDVLRALRGGLVVSVQAEADSPLCMPAIIAAMAQAVSAGGCVGLRINSPEHIRAVRAAVSVPIIGIYKQKTSEGQMRITPTLAAARACVEAGADMIAIDATSRPRLWGESLAELVAGIREVLAVPVLADVSNVVEGVEAWRLGVDAVATTLSGYVSDPCVDALAPPDVRLVADLVQAVPIPVIAEGRYNTPELAAGALAAGAWAVVVGSAITRPEFIARQYVDAMARVSRTA